jgi:hypothetical protein
VVIQATQKLPELGSAVWSAEATRSTPLEVDNDLAKFAYWIMVGGLAVNSLCPAMLLQWAAPGTQRDASMGFDAALDIIYFVVCSVAIHHVVGAASAPESILSYVSTFYPAFHAFTVASGLELAAMQRASVTDLEVDVMFQKAKRVPRVLVWCLASLKVLIVVLTIIFLCANVYPMESKTEVRCDPCVCTGEWGALKVTTCDAAALVVPNALFMEDRGITSIEENVFDDPGFDALTVLSLQRNPITTVDDLPAFVEYLDFNRCYMDDDAIATIASALSNTNGHIRTLTFGSNRMGPKGPLRSWMGGDGQRCERELTLCAFSSLTPSPPSIAGIDHLSNALVDAKDLSEVTMWGNPLGDEGE